MSMAHTGTGTDQDSWEAALERRVRDALRQIGRSQWPAENVRFWQLGVTLQDSEVASAITSIRSVHTNDAGSSARAHVTFLMCLLRSDLPGVRANRLWPDVAGRIFGRLNGGGRSTEQCAQYFRNCLRRIFKKRLSADVDFHKYVKLLLDEAGVGHDRARIIGEFLLELVKSTVELPATPDGSLELAREHVQKYLKTEGRQDVAVLEPVLVRAGTALIRVKGALLSEVNPADIDAWTWTELAEFAHGVLGEPLDRVIPEARAVFEALLPSLGGLISCAKAFQLSQQSGSDVRFPPDYRPELRLSSESDVPLGWVRIQRGGLSKTAETVDSNGFTPSAVLRLLPEHWHTRKSGRVASIRRSTNFAIERRGSSRESARPLFDENARRCGYFWSGQTWPGDRLTARSLERNGGDLGLERSPSIVPVCEWAWTGESYAFRLTGLAYYDSPRAAPVHVVAAGRILISDPMNEGNGLLRNRTEEFIPVSTASAFEGFKIELISSGESVADATIQLPGEPFAVIESRVWSLDRLEHDARKPGSISSVILVGSADWGSPKFTAGTVAEMPGLPVRTGRTGYELRFPPQQSMPEFSWGGTAWLARRRPAELTTIGARTLEVPGCTILGTGSIWPVGTSVGRLDELIFRASGVLPGQTTLLVLESGIQIGRVAIADDQSEVSLGQLLSSVPETAMRSFGPLALVHLEVDQRITGEVQGVFLAPEAAQAKPVRVGERSSLTLSFASGVNVDVESSTPAREGETLAAASWVFPAHERLAPGSGVVFQWPIDVFQVRMLADGEEIVSGRPVSLGVLQDFRLEFVGDLRRWSISVGPGRAVDHTINAQDYSELEIGEEVRRAVVAAVNSRLDAREAIFIAARFDEMEAAHWTVDESTELVAMSATCSPLEECATFEVTADWLSVSSRPVVLRVRSAGEVLAESTPVAPDRNSAGLQVRVRINVSVPNPVLASLAPGRAVSQELLMDGAVIGSCDTSAPDAELPIERIPAYLRQLVDGSQAASVMPAICRLAVVLFYDYYRRTGGMALDADVLAERLEDKFRAVECVGTASICIRCLGQIHANQGIPTARPRPTRESTRFGLVVNSICLEIVRREAAMGTMNPVELENLYLAIVGQCEYCEGESRVFEDLRIHCAELRSR